MPEKSLVPNLAERPNPKYRGSNPPAPANQSGLQLTFLRHPGISAVARYFAGGEPVSTDGFGGFNGLRRTMPSRRLAARFALALRRGIPGHNVVDPVATTRCSQYPSD